MEHAFQSNPLRKGLFDNGMAPSVIVIFGATGDLTQRKLLPALYSLFAEDPSLRNMLTIIGAARRPWTQEAFTTFAEEGIKQNARVPFSPELWQSFSTLLTYQQVEFHDEAAYRQLLTTVQEAEQHFAMPANRIFYLSTAPSYYSSIATQLGSVGLARHRATDRLLVEKPFGNDQPSAIQLNDELNAIFGEEQIYRIDHYLGKETVQNILALRFSNRIFEPLWTADQIDSVQIAVAESIGIENGRGGYYDQAGALRDMVQNHLLQLLMLVAMEKPLSLNAGDIRQRKIEVLREMRPMTPQEVALCAVRGQFRAGQINYQPVKGYLEEVGVAPDSTRETYVALKLLVNNERWSGVPFYLRTGKRLPERISEIAIKFKRPRFALFGDFGESALPANTLLIRIQPAEGISLRFDVKMPGPKMQLRAMNMDFAYDKFDTSTPEAYERLLSDGMHGDSTLFTRREENELAWGIVDAIERGWARPDAPSLAYYDAGKWGPREAAEMIRRDGRSWRRL